MAGPQTRTMRAHTAPGAMPPQAAHHAPRMCAMPLRAARHALVGDFPCPRDAHHTPACSLPPVAEHAASPLLGEDPDSNSGDPSSNQCRHTVLDGPMV